MNYEGIENSEIDEAIAKVLGLKLIKLDEPEILDWFEPTLGRQVHIEKWFYAKLLGKNISGTWDTEDNVWEHVDYPNYVDDANEALKLTVNGWILELRYVNHKLFGKWFAQYYNDEAVNVAKGYADSPAEAICRARLALAQHLSGSD